jgi:hypothetical protein
MKCKECGREVKYEFNGICIRCYQQNRRDKYYEMSGTEDVFANLDMQPGRTTYDDCRKLSDIPVKAGEEDA